MDQESLIPQKRHYRSKSDKLALIEQQVASGISVKSFCEEQGLYPSQFYEWKRKLSPKENPDSSSEHFTQVSLPIGSHAIEVHFPNGIKLSLTDGSHLSVAMVKMFLSAK